MNELDALICLTHIPYLGSIKIRTLIHHYGSALEAIQASPDALAELPGFGPKISQAWQHELKKETWKYQLDLAKKQQVQVIPYTSPHYPRRLLDIVDHPLVLYVKGSLLKEDQRALAVIGTRQASIYGLEMAKKMSTELTLAGFTIISGLARGIDTAAHIGAIEKGRTIAVLGSGLGHIYPKENQRLAEVIAERGALMSEFPFTTPPDRQHFPQRNRIVSGIAEGAVLVEAPKLSGAMNTMEQALSQGRKLFALPGRADQENFQGNHHLIKNRQAELVENVQDILIHFDHLFAPLATKSKTTHRPMLEPEEEKFIRQMPQIEFSIEEMAEKSKLPIAKLNVLLMSLVLKKIIKEYPGKIYKII